MPSLANIIESIERAYDPTAAEPWDAVGLVCGDPGAAVRRVLFAVDPVTAVIDEALAWGADLLITHHPLLLTGVHSVAATTPKGRAVHRLITVGCALYVAHTNADSADPGVSDALAEVLGVRDVRPLVAAGSDPYDKLIVFIPSGDAERLVDALAAIGAGAIGAYSRCAWETDGVGTFTPELGATPAIGEIGRREEVIESRVEMLVPRGRRRDAIEAMRAVHPYEEPSFDVYEIAAPVSSTRGTGRVGHLDQSMTLAAFTEHVAAALPATAVGVRAAGDPSREIRTVAVCGGSGGPFVEAARAHGADAYVTADLKHHATSEAMEAQPDVGASMALLDVTHWASEWPWLAAAASGLERDLADAADPSAPYDLRSDSGAADTVETRVSRLVTDPWTLHVPSTERPS